jgi:branched-chain amino acid transport system ATP-binding protein
MLAINNISVFYGGHQALKEVSVEIKRGEIVSLIGANGAGKSTILNAVAGLAHVSSGEIYFNKNITNFPPYQIVESGISLVPQERRLFPEMTINENLLLGAYPARARNEEKETLKQVFILFPALEEKKRHKAKTLSGGQQQMLAIGRALMAKPEILMFDEPSLGLSPLMVKNIFNIIKNISKDGVTIFLVEQNLHTTLEISNRAYVIETGKIMMHGNSIELMNNEYVKKAYLGIGETG